MGRPSCQLSSGLLIQRWRQCAHTECLVQGLELDGELLLLLLLRIWRGWRRRGWLLRLALLLEDVIPTRAVHMRIAPSVGGRLERYLSSAGWCVSGRSIFSLLGWGSSPVRYTSVECNRGPFSDDGAEAGAGAAAAGAGAAAALPALLHNAARCARPCPAARARGKVAITPRDGPASMPREAVRRNEDSRRAASTARDRGPSFW